MYTALSIEVLQVSSPKKLVICPYCANKGKREILGELDENGNFSVLRFHKGNTTIISKEFSVQCTCGEVVFTRRNPDGTVSIW